jgi:glycosyltransferase involved in cell wall biosynthesis
MISVCMATYNGERFIRFQIESILSQLTEEDELVIADDGSIDRTREIIHSINDDRIKLIRNINNMGPVRNFEIALNSSKGDYIFLADQDDVWLDGKVKKMLDALEKGAELVVSDCVVMNESLSQTIHPSFFLFRKTNSSFFSNLFRNSLLGCCMALNRSLLMRALPFPEKIPMHDWWLGLIGTLSKNVVLIDEKLVLYRRHSKNTSSTTNRSNNPIWVRLQWRTQILAELIRNWPKIRRIPWN